MRGLTNSGQRKHRVIGVLHHQHTVADADAQSTTGSALADDDDQEKEQR